jgi:hypothetical protein
MSSRLPILSPLGQPVSAELASLTAGIGWFIGLTLAGMALGTLYYLAVAQVVLHSQPNWGDVIRNLPRAFWQVFCLALVWLGLIILTSVPFSCLIPQMSLGGISQFALLFYLAVLAWLFFPLIFSAHGIFVYRDKMSVSVMKSVQLTRITMPSTTLFLLVGFLITQGLDIIWRWPDESSLLMLVGLAGHAFVSTAILAASFVYYRDATLWVQNIFSRALSQRQV